jgi:thioredoxin-related protein
MRKIFLLIPALALTLFASGYDDTINKGLDEGKNALFMITTKNCPYCRSTKESIIPDSSVQKELEGYVYTELDRDNDIYPKDTLFTHFVPSFFIVDPKTQELISERIGYQPKSAFIEFLQNNK